MERKWHLSWSEEGVVIVLTVGDKNNIRLTPTLKTPEEFEKELKALTQEVEKLRSPGLEEFKARESRRSPDELSPEKIWQTLGSMTNDEMMAYFNGLEEGLRKKVADYVFSHVNTFSGKGLIFAQFYDHDSAMLVSD